jgi:prefoldin subunit 5
VKRSGEYINFDNTNEDIQILLDEITSLQQENLVLNQRILELEISGSTTA